MKNENGSFFKKCGGKDPPKKRTIYLLAFSKLSNLVRVFKKENQK